MHTQKKYLIAGAIVILLSILVLTNISTIKKVALKPQDSSVQKSLDRENTPLEVIAGNLTTPWELAFLPDGNILITERKGSILKLDIQTGGRELVHTSTIEETDEGGLLGMALDPNFEENQRIYVYEGYRQKDTVMNRVVSYIFDRANFSEPSVILDHIPGAEYHDGGRIAFGPDKKLYVTTGDATNPNLPQDVQSLGGKILRMNSDGTVPLDNPFPNSLTYSYGHRNPQGIAWDDNGQLWSSEHGPSGLESGHDEINRIIPGGNYGWPLFAGNEQQVSRKVDRDEYIFPVIESGNDEAWAPASLVYHDSSLYFGGLRGQAVYRADLQGETVTNFTRFFTEEYGRIRTVTIDNEDNFYITTSNTDGRGFPNEHDDIIIKTRFED